MNLAKVFTGIFRSAIHKLHKLNDHECNRNHALKKAIRVLTMRIGVIFSALNAAFNGVLWDVKEEIFFFTCTFLVPDSAVKVNVSQMLDGILMTLFPLKRIAVVFIIQHFYYETAPHCVQIFN